MTAIESININGFKSIRELNLDLRSLNVLIGANGVGKSNFVSAFRFLNELINENLQLHVVKAGGVDVFLYFGRQITEQIEFEVTFRQGVGNYANAYSCMLIPTADEIFVFGDEQTSYHDRTRYAHPYSFVIGSGYLETHLSTEAQRQQATIARYVKEAMSSWRIYHFHDTSDTAKVKHTSDINDNRFLRPDAANLAAFLYLLQETEPFYYRNIVDTVRMIAPFLDDFALRPYPFNRDKIRLEWRERGSDLYFNANALSDGTLRFISLATLLLQPTDRLPSTILMDEPELGLHPYAINVLAELMRSAAERTQIVVSTQSVTLVNQFNPEDIIVVDRNEGQSVFRHLPEQEIDDWLDDYGLGDLWEKNILGGRPTL